jgi:hypothetical protein
LHIEGLHQESPLEAHKDNFRNIMHTSESQFSKVNFEGVSKIDILRNRYSLEVMARGDKTLTTSVLFKQLNKKLDEHDMLMTRHKEYVRLTRVGGSKEPMPEEYQNIPLKECLLTSVRSMLEEIIRTNESHHKKNYLAKVSQWYNQKVQIIDEKFMKKPIPPTEDSSSPAAKKAMKKQITMIKKREDIEKDNSPVKRVKLEMSPVNKSRLPPIVYNKTNDSNDAGGGNPFKKYYEDNSDMNRKKSNKHSDENFTHKIISLKKVDSETPYSENNAPAHVRGQQIWKNLREKKIILNRSQEQLQRSVVKWGHQKSSHHERAMVVADRNSIAYNNHSRSFKAKPITKKNDELHNYMFISQEKFLDTDNESLYSSEDEADSKQVLRNSNNDYTFEENQVKNVMKKIHDMTMVVSDHDVIGSYTSQSIYRNDSFILNKKDNNDYLSPIKQGSDDLPDIKQNNVINPIQKFNRIQKLRHAKGALIGTNKFVDPENIDSIFNNEAALKRHVSLSLYTRPKSLMDKRASTGDYQDDSLGSLSLRKKPGDRNATVQHYQSNHSQQRTKQIDEISDLKNRLTRQDVNCSVDTIQRAILFPEDRPDNVRVYPKMEELLLKNPFAKVPKKKIGKKKKKR